MTEPILTVSDLTVELGDGIAIVEDVSLTLAAGEVLGLVGESGSGKTTLALALLGYHKKGVKLARGQVRVGNADLLGLSETALRALRGQRIAYVPQDPSTSLTPSLRVADQIGELLAVHRPGVEPSSVVTTLLQRVRLPGDHAFQRRFVHQLSGGQQQRLALALALSCDPAVVVLDEPTTGLDVVTQAAILQEITGLCADGAMSAVVVSHDLAVVSTVAQRIAVMYAGRVVEQGPADVVIGAPRHPYTRGLVSSVPDHVTPRVLTGIPGVAVGVGDRPSGCAFAPRCPQRVPECEAAMPELLPAADGHLVRCLLAEQTPVTHRELRQPRPIDDHDALLVIDDLSAAHKARAGSITVVHSVSLQVRPGECLALVGESGSGKTTTARCIAGLHRPSSGRLLFDGQPLAPEARRRPSEIRRRLQMIFQSPYDSLNPTQSVADSVARPLVLFGGLGAKQAAAEVPQLLESVRLPTRLAAHYPVELSGGERQRVAIARALAAKPDLLVCDEITSALDVSVQAAVLDLLSALRADLGLALLFITHDLGVVASVADRVLVLQNGAVREAGVVEDVLQHPSNDYTQRLLAAAPKLEYAS